MKDYYEYIVGESCDNKTDTQVTKSEDRGAAHRKVQSQTKEEGGRRCGNTPKKEGDTGTAI